MGDSQQPNGNGSASKARGSTRFITKMTQVVGVGLAIAEWARPGPAQDSVLILCMAFVLGAEAVESLVLRMIDRVFDRDT